MAPVAPPEAPKVVEAAKPQPELTLNKPTGSTVGKFGPAPVKEAPKPDTKKLEKANALFAGIGSGSKNDSDSEDDKKKKKKEKKKKAAEETKEPT